MASKQNRKRKASTNGRGEMFLEQSRLRNKHHAASKRPAEEQDEAEIQESPPRSLIITEPGKPQLLRSLRNSAFRTHLYPEPEESDEDSDVSESRLRLRHAWFTHFHDTFYPRHTIPLHKVIAQSPPLAAVPDTSSTLSLTEAPSTSQTSLFPGPGDLEYWQLPVPKVQLRSTRDQLPLLGNAPEQPPPPQRQQDPPRDDFSTVPILRSNLSEAEQEEYTRKKEGERVVGVRLEAKEAPGSAQAQATPSVGFRSTPDTIATDILRAIGMHPYLPPLNFGVTPHLLDWHMDGSQSHLHMDEPETLTNKIVAKDIVEETMMEEGEPQIS
jgi:hypothetical protein